jgi:cobalamin biosynthesis Co2+ chelatase CbiK
MGHGTSHTAAVTYDQMQEQMKQLGYSNVFVGTVEGNPEDTAFPAVKKALEDAGYTKVILRPLMVVAGDHANNDMAGDEEGSWKLAFEAEGIDVECVLRGLGSIEAVQDMYVSHTADAIK